MINTLARRLNNLMKKYTPDPLVYALLLTVLTVTLGSLVEGQSLSLVTSYWGDGFWALNNFTLQMVMILFLGYVVALSQPIKIALSRLASLPKTLPQAAVCATFVSLVGCFLNWGFGLIISALYCKELGKKFGGRGFPILVAMSYSGFLVWHGGLSGSVPLLLNTPGNFNHAQLGRLVPLSETIFSSLNLTIIALHILFLPCLAYYLMRQSDQSPVILGPDDFIAPAILELKTPADKLENSFLINLTVVILAFSYILSTIITNNFTMSLDKINFILFTMALILHKTPRAFIKACEQASSKIWPILVQYPFYAGIMAIMQKSGLGELLSQFFVNFATSKTLPFLVFLSAGLLNIFIPSGGGQWAVQGPMVIDAALALKANINACMMAVAWGDSWTNMIQPFWALPLLTIAGLKAKDIMGPLIFVLLLSGLLISMCFLFFV
jgi:short-chain fatty acids transporter